MGVYPVECTEKLEGIGDVECDPGHADQGRGPFRTRVSYELAGYQDCWKDTISGPVKYAGSIRFASKTDGCEAYKVRNVTLCLK